jgi:hypothetical protein
MQHWFETKYVYGHRSASPNGKTSISRLLPL